MERNFDSDFFKRVLDHVNSNIYITDVETDEIVYMNTYMKQTFRLEDVEGKICWQVLQAGGTERCSFCQIGTIQERGGGCSRTWRGKNTVTGRVYLNHDTLEKWGGRTYHLHNSIDITGQIQLSMEASVDELTGVLNRNAGKKRLEDLLKSMGPEEQFSVALYDINGLKWVNDTYGHLEGDRLLRFVAQTIRQELNGKDFVFRLSGDEFIVAFVNKNLTQAEKWMEKIIHTLDARRAASRINYDVSFCYGLANIYGGEHLSVSDVLSIADTQMYIHKRDHRVAAGKNRLEKEEHWDRAQPSFQYDRDDLFGALSESVDGYLFLGNLTEGEFLYSDRMAHDFGLPGRVPSGALDLWEERVHPEDRARFRRDMRALSAGRGERRTAVYRARNSEGKWVRLLCKGRMIRGREGKPDLFAGAIRCLSESAALAKADTVGQEREEEYIASMLYRFYPEIQQADRADFGGNADRWALNRNRAFYFLDGILAKSGLETEDRLLDFVNRNIPGGILAVYDKPGFPLFCFNQAVLDEIHYTYEELLQVSGGCFDQLIHPDDREMVRESVAQQLAEKSVYEVRYRVLCGGGAVTLVYDRGRYVMSGDGQRIILSFLLKVLGENGTRKS